jgi:hypothetical protein
MKDIMGMIALLGLVVIAAILWPFMFMFRLVVGRYPRWYQFPRITG